MKELNFNFHLISITLNRCGLWPPHWTVYSSRGWQSLKGSILFLNDPMRDRSPFAEIPGVIVLSLCPGTWVRASGGPNTQQILLAHLIQPSASASSDLIGMSERSQPSMNVLRPALLKLRPHTKQWGIVLKCRLRWSRFGMGPESAFLTSSLIKLSLLLV